MRKTPPHETDSSAPNGVDGLRGLEEEQSPTSGETRIALGLVLAGLSWSAICALLAPNGVAQFDDVMHYLYAKWVWSWPAYLFDDWGRPGFTAPYSLAAWFGWPMCRLLSATLTAGSAWLAFRIAQMLDVRHPWATVPLAYVQPLFFQLSQTTLTETPLAFYLTVALYLALRDRWSWSAALISLCMITRHEAILFVPVWTFFAWRRGTKLWRLWPILWAPIVANIGASAFNLSTIVQRLFDPEPTTQYGRGGWLTFFARGLHAWGPGVAMLAMTGLWKMSRQRNGMFVATCILAYFATQTVIRALGLYGSGGYARFLVPISPLIAIAALVGWQQLWHEDTGTRRRAVMLAAASMILLWLALERQIDLHQTRGDIAVEAPTIYLATLIIRILTVIVTALAMISVFGHAKPRWQTYAKPLLPGCIFIIVLLTCYALCRPLKPPEESLLIDEARGRLATMGLGDRIILSANAWIDLVNDRPLSPYRPSVREQLEDAPVGTLFAWERQFAGSDDHRLRLSEFQESPSFRLVYQTPSKQQEKQPYLTIFEKIGDWGPPSADNGP
ncbi:MAG: hypothetical protein MI923_26485 [Phycisphaerales bacterium]|nr:hypothetical protein [Phycisphaerales bacterium]